MPNLEPPPSRGSGPSGPFLVPVHEAASRLKVDEETVKEMVLSGEFEGRTPGNVENSHVTPDSLIRAMARQEAKKVILRGKS